MATLVIFLTLFACAQAQLDLPPLPTPAAVVDQYRVTPTPAKSTFNGNGVRPQSASHEAVDAAIVVDDNDDDDEPHGGARASHYDRDRSERFGPPYSLDNIARSPPTLSSDNLADERLGETHRNSDYPGANGPFQKAHNNYQQPYANNGGGGSGGGGDRYNEGRPRSNGDDYRFYRDPDSERYGNDDLRGRSRAYGDDDKYYRSGQQQDNYNNNNAYPGYSPGYGNNNNGGGSGGGGGGGYGFARGPGAIDAGVHRDTGGGGGYYGNNDPFSNRNRDQSDNYNNNNNNRPLFEDDRTRYEQNRLNQLEVAKLKQLLAKVDRQSSVECALNVRAQWDFETNVNEITQIQALKAQQRYSDFQRLVWEEMRHIDKDRIVDPKLFRQVTLMSNIGASALPPDQLDRYNRIVNDMLAIYNKASICRFEQPFNCGLRLQPQLKEIMATNRDWEELQYTWTEFRRKSGRDMRDLYEQLVELTNEAAHYNNFSSAAAYWTFPYESPDFRRETEHVWEEILPLYELIHAYVRRKLREFYGPDRINRNAPLPEHVLGNMYGQTWSNILDVTIPYPGRHFLEVTPAMLAQGYTPHVMFQLAEDFFLSINMTVLPTDFWIDSVTEQPQDGRTVLCQPSAWDFCNGHDFRVKMCTEVTHKDLITVHHEMTHVQYFVSYRSLPKVFREGANAAFHEALGDAVTLSVGTPRHLQTLGLIQKSVDDTAHDINYLFALALDKVVFLPFALSLDRWRWDIFDQHIGKEQYNCHWWLLRERYSGIKPPVLRSEMDFDPGAKYHVPANIPYIRYFVSTVLQFQIHRAMCRETHQFRAGDPHHPLHKCDIYRQPAAGNVLRRIMERGTEQPWQETLQEVIGEGRLDGSALREYFRPLEEWLRNENLRNNEFVGWTYDGDYCKHSIDTANLQVYGGFYNGGHATTAVDATTTTLAALACAITATIIALQTGGGGAI